MERILCDTISSVLNTENVGINDDFVLLGGNSLKAMTIASRFNSAMISRGVHTTSALLLKLRTPKNVCENTMTNESQTVRQYDEKTGCPLIDAQRSILEYYRVSGELDLNLIVKFGNRRWVSVTKAKKAINKVIAAHPALRSRLVDRDGHPLLAFEKKGVVEYLKCDPMELDSSFMKGIDPEKDVLARFVIVFWNGSCSVLCELSHLIFDGISGGILEAEFGKAYDGQELEYEDGLFRQEAYERSLRGTSAFRSKFDSVCAKIRRWNLGDPIGGRSKKGVTFIKMDLPCTAKEAESAAKRHGMTTGMFLGTVFGHSLAKYTKKDDLTYFISTDGRDNLDHSNSIGMYVRYVPIRARTGGMECEEYLERNRNYIMDMMLDSDIPCWMIRERMDIRFNVVFQYHHFITEDSLKSKSDGALITPNTSLSDSMFSVFPSGKGFYVVCSFLNKYPRSKMAGITKEFLNEIGEMTYIDKNGSK